VQIATILLSVGLLTTTASVSQMLRGSGMVFSALFAVWFLKRSLNRRACHCQLGELTAARLCSFVVTPSSRCAGSGMPPDQLQCPLI
jgi:hypothetical protein